MRKKGSRFLVLFALLLVALSQIMCKMPTKEEALQTAPDDVDLDELLSGVFDVNIVDQEVIEHPDCPGDLMIPYFGPVISFEVFDEPGNRVILTTPEGKQFFEKVSPGKYCSMIGNPDTSDRMVCLDNFSEKGYVMNVSVSVEQSDGTYKSQECYRATHILTSTIDELLAEEIINEVPEEEGETAPPISNDPQPQPEEPPKPELQPDPVPEESELEACNANGFIQLSGDRQVNGRYCTCAYRLTFNNSHALDAISVMLVKSVDLGDGSVTRWEHHTIAPGGAFIWESDLDGTCTLNQVDAYSAIFDKSECHGLRSSNSEEVNAMAVPVETMCTEWSKNGE